MNALIPNNKLTCKEIIKYVDHQFPEKELLNFVNCEFLRCGRLRRRNIGQDNLVNYFSTTTVCVTFSGFTIPKFVSMYD